MEFSKLQQLIAGVLDVDAEDITPESSFKDDLGADSLDLLTIVTEIEDALGISIEDDDLEGIVTVQDALDAIAKGKKS